MNNKMFAMIQRLFVLFAATVSLLLIPNRFAFAEHAKGQIIVVFQDGATLSTDALSQREGGEIGPRPSERDSNSAPKANDGVDVDQEPALEEGADGKQEVILRSQQGDAAVDMEDGLQELGYEVEATLDKQDGETTVLCDVPQGVSVEEAVARIEELPGVEYVQPNYVYHIVDSSTQDNVLASSALSIDQQKNLVAAHVPSAWKEANVKTNGTISVAVIDTGCRLTHEDLRDNVDVDHAWDYWNGEEGVGQKLTSASVPNNGDDEGHGSHVCGIVAAKAENGLGVDGASYDAKVIPIKVANSNGRAYTSDMVLAVSYARQLRQGSVPNLRVINMSLGGDTYDQAMKDAIDEATDAGILVVCSAGNDSSTSAVYPSDYDNAFSVMALEEDESFAPYTSYNEHKDISAVGIACSAYNGSDKDYDTRVGTSMAAPLVSGVAALVWSVNPAMSVDQVRAILLDTSQPVTKTNGANVYEHLYGSELDTQINQVNAYDAVTRAQETFGAGATKKKVAPPSATSFEYNGKEHVGVPDGVGYSLKLGDVALEGSSKATDAGEYVITAILDDGYTWTGLEGDEASANIELHWSISKAPLKATYITQVVAPNTPWESIQNTIRYSGFVNGETEGDVFVGEMGSPSVQKPEDYDTYCGESGHSWVLVPTEVELTNYDMECVAGKLILWEDSAILRKVPASTTAFVYDGTKHQAVREGDWYELSGDVRKVAASNIKIINGEPVTGSERYEQYETTITLKHPTDFWTDGTQEPKSVCWVIKKRPLKLTYNESWVLKGSSIPQNIKVEGFVASEESAILNSATSGFKLPALRWSNMDYGFRGTRITDEIARKILGTRGDYTLVPDPYTEGGNNYDPTSNYEFQSFSPGTLHVCDAVGVPAATNRTYNGSVQRGVANGNGYAVSGTATATNAGTYTAYVTPKGGYLWPDGKRDKRTIRWSIAKASVASASVAAIPRQTYRGSAITPVPTVKLGATALRRGVDYDLTYANNVKVGLSTITIRGKGNCTGTKSVTFWIGAASIAGASVTGIANQAYTGNAVTPLPTVRLNNKVLRLNVDYRLSYINNVRAGTAKVVANGIGNYTGSASTTFRIVAPSVTYRTHVQNIGWQGWRSDGVMCGTSGRGLRLEGINLKLSSLPVSGGIRYRTHVQNIGWQGWRYNGSMSGTSGRGLRLEAIEIQLTGKMAERYDVWYRAHAQNFGWLGWTRNGGRSGTAGYGYRLEGMQILLVPKGQGAPPTTYRGIRQTNWRSFAQRR